MGFRTVFKPTSATFGFIIFSSILFGFGYYVGGLVDRDPHKVAERDKILAGFLLGVGIPAGATYLNFFINSRIENESNIKIQENENKCEKRVKSYAINYLKNLDSVETILLKLNNEVTQSCLPEVIILRQELEKYVENYKVAREVVQWLDEKQHRDDLAIKVIVKIAEAKYKISLDSEAHIKFSQDTYRLLNWLRDSIDILNSFPVEGYLVQALKPGCIEKIDIYEDALEYIKKLLSKKDELKWKHKELIYFYIDELKLKLQKLKKS